MMPRRHLLFALLLAGCAPSRTALDASAVAAAAQVADVDREGAIVDQQVKDEYKARAALCFDDLCRDRADAATRQAMRPRTTLAADARAAANRAADAIEAADRCDTSACRATELAKVAAAQAEVTALLVRLRQTAPKETPR